MIGIVHTHEPDGGRGFAPPDAVSCAIAEHVSQFLLDEIASGRIPAEFLPLQSGVGNVCNAVLAGLAESTSFPKFKVYTEVLQDAMLDLIADGTILGASACSLTLTNDKLQFLYDHFDDFADRIVLRPQEISNSPEVARRLGVVAINTAIEVDVYGHANSTHFYGTQVMNGLGGSGDFDAQRLSLDLHVSVGRQGGAGVDDRADVLARRPQRALGAGGRDRARPGRPSGARAGGPRRSDHRSMRPSGLSRLSAPVSRIGPDGSSAARSEAVLRAALELPRVGRDASRTRLETVRGAEGGGRLGSSKRRGRFPALWANRAEAQLTHIGSSTSNPYFFIFL